MMRIVMTVLVLILGSTPAQAQTPEVLTPLMLKDLRDWMDEAKEWYEWDMIWHNRVLMRSEHNVEKDPKRKPRPKVPTWLAQECEQRLLEPANLIADACLFVARIQGSAMTESMQRQQAQNIRLTRDRPLHSFFFRQGHIDGPGAAGSSQGSVYNMIGFHVTGLNFGKIYLYGPPGVAWLRMPDRQGKYHSKWAYSWGASYEFYVKDSPNLSAPLSFHLNFTKVWLIKSEQDVWLARGGLDMFWVSMSLKRRQVP